MSTSEEKVTRVVEPSTKADRRYVAVSQGGRRVCPRCNDGDHKWCFHFDCECLCQESVPKPPKVVRGRDGLSDVEREAQNGFAFGDSEPLTIKAEKLKAREEKL
jgi:hypothetical protein